VVEVVPDPEQPGALLFGAPLRTLGDTLVQKREKNTSDGNLAFAWEVVKVKTAPCLVLYLPSHLGRRLPPLCCERVMEIKKETGKQNINHSTQSVPYQGVSSSCQTV